MTKGNDSIQSIIVADCGDGEYCPYSLDLEDKPTDLDGLHLSPGLTKREYFAIHASADIPLQSQTFLEETLKRPVNPKNFDSYLDDQCEALAIMKVRIADKLIKELNK